MHPDPKPYNFQISNTTLIVTKTRNNKQDIKNKNIITQIQSKDTSRSGTWVLTRNFAQQSRGRTEKIIKQNFRFNTNKLGHTKIISLRRDKNNPKKGERGTKKQKDYILHANQTYESTNNNTKKQNQSRDFGIISHATDDYNHTNQRLMCLTLFHPFLHESPTIFTPFLSKTLSSLALSFICCSNPPMRTIDKTKLFGKRKTEKTWVGL